MQTKPVAWADCKLLNFNCKLWSDLLQQNDWSLRLLIFFLPTHSCHQKRQSLLVSPNLVCICQLLYTDYTWGFLFYIHVSYLAGSLFALLHFRGSAGADWTSEGAVCIVWILPGGFLCGRTTWGSAIPPTFYFWNSKTREDPEKQI